MKKVAVLILVCSLVVGICAVAGAQELSFQELADKVEEKLKSIEDARLVLEFDMVQIGQKTRTVMGIKGSKEHKLTRIEILAPDIAAGQIMLLDMENSEMRMYMPALNQIIVQSLAASAAGYGINIDLDDLTQSLSLEGLAGEIIEVVETEAGLEYVVAVAVTDEQVPVLVMQGIEVDPKDLVQHIWIDAQFIPYKLESFQDGTSLGSLVLSEYEINVGMETDELREMPDVPLLQF